MKRDKRTIDDILRRYLKSASQEEVESAGAEVLNRLRDGSQDAINKFTMVYRPGIDEPIPEPENLQLGSNDRLVLIAVSLLQGKGQLLAVVEKTSELASRDVGDFSVMRSLARMENSGFIEPWMDSPIHPLKRIFKITPRGERALAAANLAAEQVRDHLEDLI